MVVSGMSVSAVRVMTATGAGSAESAVQMGPACPAPPLHTFSPTQARCLRLCSRPDLTLPPSSLARALTRTSGRDSSLLSLSSLAHLATCARCRLAASGLRRSAQHTAVWHNAVAASSEFGAATATARCKHCIALAKASSPLAPPLALSPLSPSTWRQSSTQPPSP
eukprot:2832-Pleurochrysis_carterae.AAC.1